jgi:guanylate kinase
MDGLAKMFASLEPHLRNYERLQAPWALVIGRQTGQVREALEAAKYNVECIERELLDTAALGQYRIHQRPFRVIILDGPNFRSLGDQIKSAFPGAYFGCVSGESYKRDVYNKGFLFWSRADPDLAKGLIAFGEQHYQIVPLRSSRMGTCYVLAGPSATGKSTASQKMRDINPDIIAIQKHTTRTPREEEVPGKHMQFRGPKEMEEDIKNKKYLTTYEVDGYKYGIPMDLSHKLRNGEDCILTVTDPSTMPQVLKELESQAPQSAVPILFYASAKVLYERLDFRRAQRKENLRRQIKIANQLGEYRKHPDWYKHAINTGRVNEEEETNILASIIQWERYHKRDDYVDTILSRVLPDDFFKRVLAGNEVELRIPDYAIEAYAQKNKMNVDVLRPLQTHHVRCVTEFYGRVGIFLDPLIAQSIPGLNVRDEVLNLIQESVELIPRLRNTYWTSKPLSVFARCARPKAEPYSNDKPKKDLNMTFNDGLLYKLGDDIVRREATGAERYVVAFGFISTRLSRPIPVPMTDSLNKVENNFQTLRFKDPYDPEEDFRAPEEFNTP